MEDWIIHLALTNILAFWWLITIGLCILTAFLTFAYGSIRWWNTKNGSLTKLWNQQRKEFQQEIFELDALLRKTNRKLHFYQHRSYVKAIKKLHNEASNL